MAFNKVQTQEEAAAFKYLQDQSTVLHTIDTNEIYVNGVNVITKNPAVGDVLCVTERYNGTSLRPPQEQDIVWIKGNSVNFKEWPSKDGKNIYEPVGVCYKIRGGKAYVRFRSEVSRRWSESERWLVTNTSALLALTGTLSGTVSATSGITSGSSFTMTGSNNLRTFCINLQNALAGITGNTAISCQYVGPHDYDPVDVGSGHYDGNDGVMIINARFTADAWNDVSMNIGGVALSLSRSIGRDIPADSTNFRQNGGQQYWGGCNFYRFYDYYSTNGRTLSSAPSSSIDTDSPVKEQVFNESGYAAIYRNVYGTYKNYLRSCMVQWPTCKGANGKYFDKGHEFTEKLARAKYISMASGSPVVTYLYGPAHYCGVEVSANVLGLESGSWWLPSSGEMIELMQDITYGTSEYSTNGNLDPVNAAIYRLNDNTFDTSKGFRFAALSAGGSYLWVSNRHALNHIWSYDHYDGALSTNWLTHDVAFGGFTAHPITTVNISQ